MRAASQATVSCESGGGNAPHAKVRASDPPPSRHARWFTPAAQAVGVFLSGVVGGESGIRTHDALIAHTRSPGVRLRPLGHLSARAAFYPRKKKSPPRGGRAHVPAGG